MQLERRFRAELGLAPAATAALRPPRRRNDENTPDAEKDEMQFAGEEIEIHLQSEKEKREGGFEDPPYKIDLVGADEKIRGAGGDRMIDQSRCCCCDGEVEMVFDWEMFFGLLCKASLVEGKVYSQLSYLCSLAYSIPISRYPRLFLGLLRLIYWLVFVLGCWFLCFESWNRVPHL